MCPAVDRTAMVTGASRGIGAVTAGALPAAGARGVLAARDPAPPGPSR
jgi:NAD(P)-dependent dehydrogenase (short-subunit alcohol dehydrogenase family)